MKVAGYNRGGGLKGVYLLLLLGFLIDGQYYGWCMCLGSLIGGSIDSFPWMSFVIVVGGVENLGLIEGFGVGRWLWGLFLLHGLLHNCSLFLHYLILKNISSYICVCEFVDISCVVKLDKSKTFDYLLFWDWDSFADTFKGKDT